MACSVFGQAQVRFSTEEYDYGIIPYGTPETAVITVTNTGNSPLVINKVYTSCGCTVADWDKHQIAPGKEGTIKVEYDAMLMGHFYKEITVYCNAEPHIFNIALVGEVSNTKVDYTKSHPYRMGDVLLDTGELLFDDIRLGHKYSREISVVNMSEEPYEPSIMLLPSYMSIECEPEVLKHRQMGKITVTLDGDKMRAVGVGLVETSVYLSRFPGDKICDETNIPVSAFVLPEAPAYTEDELKNAPDFFITATDWNVDTNSRKKRYSKTVEIGNSGKSNLVIEQLQVSGRMISVSLSSKVIKPGTMARLKIKVNPKHAGRNKVGRVYIITNDPNRPKEVITVKL